MQLITLVDGSDHIGSVKAGYHSLVHLDSNPSTSPYPLGASKAPGRVVDLVMALQRWERFRSVCGIDRTLPRHVLQHREECAALSPFSHKARSVDMRSRKSSSGAA